MYTSKNTDISDGRSPQGTVLYLDYGGSYPTVKTMQYKGWIFIRCTFYLNKPDFEKILER